MNDDELRSFIDTLRRFSDAVEKTGDPLLDYRKRVSNAAEAANKETAARKALMEKQRQSVTNFASSILSHTQRLTDSKGSFNALSGAIDLSSKALGSLAGKFPVIGGLLKGAVEGLAEGVKFITAEFEKAYGTFEQLSDTGVVRTFENLQMISAKTGMNFQDVNKILSKNSKSFTFFGSSVTDGVQNFQRLAEQSEEIRYTFQRLGVNVSDFNDYQIQYLERLQMAGQLEGKTDADLIEGTKAYINQLDALSKLTGKSRKDIQSEMEARTRDARYNAAVADMDEKTRKRFDNLLTILPKDLSEGMKDIIAAGGAVTTEAAKSVVLKYGDQAIDIGRQMSQGIMPAYSAVNSLRANAKAFTTENKELIKVVGDTPRVFKGVAEAQMFAAQKNIENDEEMSKMAEETRKQQNTVNSSLADARQNLYKTSQQIEQFATSFDSVTVVIEKFSDAIKNVITYVNENIGSGPGGSEIGQPGFLRRMFGSNSSQSTTTTDQSRMTRSSGINQNNVDQLLTFGSNSEGLENFNKLNSQVKNNFLAMAREYNTINNQKLQINSSYRSLSDQQRLYNDWLAGKTKNPVAVPGTSKHELGRALDLQSSQVLALKSMGLLDKYGFKTLDNDPPHIYMKEGGISNGPTSGYPAELHGNEMVQPLDQNSILQKLATTPSSIAESDARTNSRQLVEETHAMTRKYDEMIKVLSDIRNIQKTLMMRTYA